MHLVTNDKLARNRFRLGTAFHMVGLAILLVGLVVSLQPVPEEANSLRLLAPYAAIVVFLIPNYFGKRYLQRYGPKSRQDAALAQAAKGLDNRYTLLAFASNELPDYLMIGPAGIYVLVPRSQSGVILCRGDRWEREGVSSLSRVATTLWGTPLGNPSQDVDAGIVQVRRALERRSSDEDAEVPIQGVVVLTNPQARHRIEGCGVKVTTLKNLKTYLRGEKASLPPPRIARLRDALSPESRQ